MRLILYIIILFPLLFIGQNNTTLKIQEDSLIYLLNEERIKSIYEETIKLNKQSLIYVTHNNKYAKKADKVYEISNQNLIEL